jgi:exopolysaccharide biosynthesis polyprenyl glycosylphosphotransferase
MLKQYATFFRRSMIIVDMFIAAVAFGLAYVVRDQVEGLYFFSSYLWIIPFLSVSWGIFLYILGMYKSFRLKSMFEVVSIILRAGGMVFLLFGCITYIFKIGYVSRGLIGCAFGFTIGLVALEKILLVVFFRYLRKKGFNFRNLLVVGTGRRARAFITQINHRREFGLKIVSVIDPDKSRVGQMVCGHPVVGTLDDIPDILINTAIDNVIFIVPRSVLNDIEKQILCCETLGVTAHVAVDLFPMQFTQGRPESLLGLPIMTFESVSDKHQQLIIKRILDIILSGIGLIVLGPVFLTVALLVKFTSEGPVLFSQERCSLNGRRFKLYKFRTMVQDAEAKIAELMAYNQMEGPAFKMDNDPRITPVGKWLRKLSLDELPQLWNVFQGDMSLVGPRPPLPKEVQQYDFWQRRRLSMRPGITCLWQVGGRNKIKDFDEWAKLDLKYIDEWSLALDFKILLKTFPVVVTGAGAK